VALRVEEQLAELQAEVAELRRVLSGSGNEPDSKPSDELRSGGGVTSSLAEANASLDPAHLELRLTILVPATLHRDPHLAQGSPQGHPVDAGAEAQVCPVVLVQAPDELLDWARTQPEPLHHHVESLLEGVQEQLSQRVAGSLVDVAWEPATAAWHVVDFGGFDSLSGLFETVDD